MNTSTFDTTTISNKGSWTSLLIGGLIGIATILLFSVGALVFLSGFGDNGFVGFGFLLIYKNSIIGLTIAFLLSLWFTGRQVEIYLIKGQRLLWVSTKYSLTTNIFIWAVFIIIQTLDNFDVILSLIIPLILFLISTATSIFTVGLLICYIIKKRITRNYNVA